MDKDKARVYIVSLNNRDAWHNVIKENDASAKCRNVIMRILI